MPYYDVYFIISQYNAKSNELCMTCKYFLTGKINQHGVQYNYIETPVTNWRLKLVPGLDNQNIDNRYRYSTFTNNRYRDQILICTYAYVHSVQRICFFLKNILVT